LSAHTHSIQPGFIALHGNRAEDLAQTVLDWLRLSPLDPLEEEVVLVQSNGMAEWFKMDMAARHGVCAAARVELPGRFLWRTYRQVLGPRAVPRHSPLDKVPLTWRLMALLPTLLANPELAPVFAPVQAYLRPNEPDRLMQLATTLADLLDQYQNYRTDWLQDWAQGQDVLRQANGIRVPLPPEQRWQAELWRAVVATLDDSQQAATRPQLHREVLAALNGDEALAGRVARRVVVYGMSHLPGATLETLAALSRHSQVVLAIPNPCRHDWGDIMEGRELFNTLRRRQSARDGQPLAAVALEDMHQHAHPLLAAWGRQGRDFIRQLDAFDDAPTTRQQFSLPRIDIFDDTPDAAHTPLLARVQHRIRDLEPARFEGDESPVPPQDLSICFHTAHSRVRELEVLQDQLLHWLAAPPDQGQAPLHPRDVVVMVPDIEAMAPAIRAVFGQYSRHDPRHIPFDIADLSAQSSSLVITALEWLLRVPTQRCGLSELVDLLEVPAVAARFGLEREQLPALTQWMAGAGIRWGLHQGHRQRMGLGACGEQNSAWFGLQRMLLGYSSGGLAGIPADTATDTAWAHIEPYTEVGGLDADMAGSLAHLIQALRQWWAQAVQPATPAEWVARGRALLQAFFKPVDEADQQALAALDAALMAWAQACDDADFAADLDLGTCRQAWLQALDVPSLERRFRAGGITFCTLMPMRAIPFEVVCLLGMNDGDYPRQTLRSDFDLMAGAGQFRPGDRSRRQDDRQLMLEALLSARRTLYISWTGHSVRDNSEQPPSVLVSQLRDYLAAVWGPQVVAQRTTAHPLQPFSRRYFEAGSGLQTWAREWRVLHHAEPAGAVSANTTTADPATPALPPFEPNPNAPLTLQRLTQFLRNPVKAFFKERLGISFYSPEEAGADEEPFGLSGLDHHGVIQAQVSTWPQPGDGPLTTAATTANAATTAATSPPTSPPTHSGAAPALASSGIAPAVARLRRSGQLPLQAFGDLKQAELQATLHAMAQGWERAGAAHPHRAPRQPIAITHNGVTLRDWLEPLFQSSPGPASASLTWLALDASKLLDKKGQIRPDKLLAAWVRALAAAACGHTLHGVVVSQNGTLLISPMAADAGHADEAATQVKQATQATQAKNTLQMLLELWHQGMQAPLPLPLKTALAAAREAQTGKEQNPDKVYEGADDGRAESQQMAEVNDPCLARTFPDFEALEAHPDFRPLAEAVYGPLLQWVGECVRVEG
jgi:exodeoxyribonuclease V gamma subunit